MVFAFAKKEEEEKEIKMKKTIVRIDGLVFFCFIAYCSN